MWKLLPPSLIVGCLVSLLVSCAAGDSKGGHNNQFNEGRIMRHLELPVQFSAPTGNHQLAKKLFQTSGMQGWVDETGAWHIEGEVHHSRFLCGTYQTGIQLGKGSMNCLNAEWLTDVQYTPGLTHCNSVTRLHAGRGVFTDGAKWFGEVSCVRVVVRCEGHC